MNARNVQAAAFAAALAAGGCTSARFTTAPRLRPLPAELQLGRLAERTAFEVEAWGPKSGDTAGAEADDEASKGRNVRRGLVIAGIVAASVGAATAIAFGAAGQVTENQLDDGYDEGLTRSEEADFQDRGELYNGIAIGGATLAVVGVSVAAIFAGIEYTRCGRVLKKRSRGKSCEK